MQIERIERASQIDVERFITLPGEDPASVFQGIDTLFGEVFVVWHRAGADIETRMPALSNYLGHTNPSGTYWYLTAVPELMELAAARLDTRRRP